MYRPNIKALGRGSSRRGQGPRRRRAACSPCVPEALQVLSHILGKPLETHQTMLPEFWTSMMQAGLAGGYPSKSWKHNFKIVLEAAEEVVRRGISTASWGVRADGAGSNIFPGSARMAWECRWTSLFAASPGPDFVWGKVRTEETWRRRFLTNTAICKDAHCGYVGRRPWTGRTGQAKLSGHALLSSQSQAISKAALV